MSSRDRAKAIRDSIVSVIFDGAVKHNTFNGIESAAKELLDLGVGHEYVEKILSDIIYDIREEYGD